MSRNRSRGLLTRGALAAATVTAAGAGLTGLASAQSISHTGPGSYNSISSGYGSDWRSDYGYKVNDWAWHDMSWANDWEKWNPVHWQNNGHSFDDWYNGCQDWLGKHTGNQHWYGGWNDKDYKNGGYDWSSYNPHHWKNNGGSYGGWHQQLTKYMGDHYSNWEKNWGHSEKQNGHKYNHKNHKDEGKHAYKLASYKQGDHKWNDHDKKDNKWDSNRKWDGYKHEDRKDYSHKHVAWYDHDKYDNDNNDHKYQKGGSDWKYGGHGKDKHDDKKHYEAKQAVYKHDDKRGYGEKDYAKGHGDKKDSYKPSHDYGHKDYEKAYDKGYAHKDDGHKYNGHGSGYGGSNHYDYDNRESYVVRNDNNVTVSNDVDQVAVSGDVESKYNTWGGHAESGEASNYSNNAFAVSINNETDFGSYGNGLNWNVPSLGHTGYGSWNRVDFDNRKSVVVDNDNDVDINNTVRQTAVSGDVESKYNTWGGHVSSGDASNVSTNSFNVSIQN